MTYPTLDPVVLLQQARKRYLIKQTISIACMAVLIGITMQQADRLERQDSQLLANEHAIVNLMESSRKLKEADQKLAEVCRPALEHLPIPLGQPTLPDLAYEERLR